MLTQATRQADFPWLEGQTYLNTAAEGIPPRPVVEAIHQYAQDKLLGMDGRELHKVQWAAIKKGVARAYGLTDAEVSVCSCTSEAYNLFGSAVKLAAGDEVVVNNLDYPAGVSIWLHAGGPAAVKVWRHRAWALRVEDLIPLLSPRTRVVQLSLVSFFNGFYAPLREIVEAVHKHSRALIAVDVTQALGRVPLDLRGVDFVVSSTHKWLLGTHGGGLVGVRQSRVKELTPSAGGWFNLQDPFNAERFDRPAENLPGAAGYTPGMPNYPAVYAVRAALDYIDGVGVPAIRAHADPLVRACLQGLKKLPVELITPDEPEHLAGIVSFRHADSQRIHKALHEKWIHVMHQAGRVRIAIHGYNTPADIEKLLGVLRETIGHA